MEKKFYLNGEHVKINDRIMINGREITLTQNFIQENSTLFKIVDVLPEYVEIIVNDGHFKKGDIIKTKEYPCGQGYSFIFNHKVLSTLFGSDKIFEIFAECPYSEEYKNYFKPSTKNEYDRHLLYEESKKRYPIGIKIKSIYGDNIIIQDSDEIIISDTKILNLGYIITIGDTIVYIKNQWVDTIKPIINTIDDVDIYHGDELFLIIDGKIKRYIWSEDSKNDEFNIDKYSNKFNTLFFSSEEKALEWIITLQLKSSTH